MTRKSWVKAGDEWVDIKTTTFIDIEEGPFGDEYTFTLSDSDEVFKSRIVIGSKPG
jgi:hypothetical protein